MRPAVKVLITLSLFVLTSCIKDVDLDSREVPEVVVECVLTDQQPQVLYLSLTKGASLDKASVIDEAEITLVDLTIGLNCGEFVTTKSGEWELDYKAVPGHGYRLEVRVPGHNVISAEQIMPESVDIKVSHAWSPALSSSRDYPGHPKYGYDQGSFFDITYLPDYTWVYGLDYNREDNSYTVAEEICTDFEGVDNFNLIGRLYNPLISQDSFFSGIYGWQIESCDGWALYPHLIGSSLHWRYLRLDKSKIAPEKLEEEFQISGDFSGDYFSAIGGIPKQEEGRLVFASVSKDYDTYLQEAFYFQRLQLSDDMSSIFVRDNVFSNITGGLGIFGAQTVNPIAWSRIESPVNPVKRTQME